jgi:hypothetical protein
MLPPTLTLNSEAANFLKIVSNTCHKAQKTQNRINMKNKSPQKLKLLSRGSLCLCHDSCSDRGVIKMWGIKLLTLDIFHLMISPREACLTGTE